MDGGSMVSQSNPSVDNAALSARAFSTSVRFGGSSQGSPTQVGLTPTAPMYHVSAMHSMVLLEGISPGPHFKLGVLSPSTVGGNGPILASKTSAQVVGGSRQRGHAQMVRLSSNSATTSPTCVRLGSDVLFLHRYTALSSGARNTRETRGMVPIPSMSSHTVPSQVSNPGCGAAKAQWMGARVAYDVTSFFDEFPPCCPPTNQSVFIESTAPELPTWRLARNSSLTNSNLTFGLVDITCSVV
mmetsp:Transcript_48441/g.113359  ORF Transcript_48441/g.113359 Transcript_48441/m.113359 type:complete len:242 (-) Transcript_48441:5698-6423(-)